METYPKPQPGELWRIRKSWTTGSGFKTEENIALVLSTSQPPSQFNEIVFTSYDVMIGDERTTILVPNFVEKLC